jgi:hypothetical protein
LQAWLSILVRRCVVSTGHEEYRKLVGFDDKDKSLAWRAKHLLFFVTRVNRLRNDMTPAVIKDRLEDWGYEGTTVDEIRRLLETDPDVRSSRTRKGAYEITQAAEIRIRKEYNFSKNPLWRGTALQPLFMLVTFSLLVLLTIIAYHTATSRTSVQDLSLTEYRVRIGFDKPSATPADRAAYLLYFITKVVELRSDMTPDVIAERLHDMGYDDIKAPEIQSLFLSSPDVRPSLQREGAFDINPLAATRYMDMLDLDPPLPENLTLRWLWQRVPMAAWVALGVGLTSLLSTAFIWGYKLGTHAERLDS